MSTETLEPETANTTTRCPEPLPPEADNYPVIERDTEQNVRVKLLVPSRFGGTEEFRSVWRLDIGRDNATLILTALKEYKASLALAHQHEAHATAADAERAGYMVERFHKTACRFAARWFRPADRPEYLAVVGLASGYARYYRIVPDWTPDGPVLNVVYDEPEDDVFGVEHERNLPDYDAATHAVAFILDRFPPHVERLEVTDPLVTIKLREIEAERAARQAEQERADAEAREKMERESYEQAAARHKLFDRKVKATRGGCEILTACKGVKAPVSGVRVGSFMVHRPLGGADGYAVSHIPSGMGAGRAASQRDGKILAWCLAQWGDWSFTATGDRKTYPTLAHGAKVTRLWRAADWPGLVKHLKAKGVKL